MLRPFLTFDVLTWVSGYPRLPCEGLILRANVDLTVNFARLYVIHELLHLLVDQYRLVWLFGLLLGVVGLAEGVLQETIVDISVVGHIHLIVGHCAV